MEWDHLAEEKGQELFASWLELLSQNSPSLPLQLAERHRPDHRATDASDFTTDAYNMCCIVTFEDGFRVVVRFPILGRSRFRTEKSRDEVAVMMFLSKEPQIPVPIVLGAVRWGCGPYVVTTFVEGTLLSRQLKDASPSQVTLERAYHEISAYWRSGIQIFRNMACEQKADDPQYK
ncbi:hypothetical protein AJ79_05426 [Helicocarpus griseus UAMH5409]|uniref:Aminoglycoside phosphotransferase domain-containing protein n=1 Tax=Helicocarpus griseus UAMH5409 TaxID=1447875 RepID=A0A2B7XPG9_9EURO|nr:hypothetical protein AJ79_05426 [Helicocarpus griseus UAMH5409]